MKTCRTCQAVKPLSGFHRRADSPDGHRTECKGCVLAYQREAYRLKGESVREYARRYRASEHGRAVMRAYRSSERGRARQRESQKFWRGTRRLEAT